MPAKFTPAPEVEAIAASLISQYHQRLLTHKVRIEYLFRDDEPRKDGQKIWGQARKVGGLNAFLATVEEGKPAEPELIDCRPCKGRGTQKGAPCAHCKGKGVVEKPDDSGAPPFFVLLITAAIWADLSEEHRRALVDHELCHMGACMDREGKTKLYIIGHDLEEFCVIVDRYGLWRRSVEDFAAAASRYTPQLRLDVEPEPPGVEAVTFHTNGREVTVTAEQLRRAGELAEQSAVAV